MIWNLPPLPALPTDRFAMVLYYLLAYIGKQMRPGADNAVLVAACRRVEGLRKRFRTLVERWRAGTLPPPRPRAGPRKTATERPPRPPDALPRQAGWLCHLVPQHAAICGQWLRELMADEEMIKLVQAAPQAGRILRPLFRMVGTEMPTILIPPPRAQPEGTPAAVRRPRRSRAAAPAPIAPPVPPPAVDPPEASPPGYGRLVYFPIYRG